MPQWEEVSNNDDLGIMPLSQFGGLPENHVVTVIERRLEVDNPILIQKNIQTDTVELDLDAEWEGITPVIVFGSEGDTTEVLYNGEPVHIPASVMQDVETVELTVVGYNADYTQRLVTVKAPVVFNVIQAGVLDTKVVREGGDDLLAQIIAAYTKLNNTADQVNATYVKSASATTLDPGSQATATIENNVLKIGVPEGLKGDKGDQGDKGDTGTAATIQVGTVSKLAPGSTPTVVNAGTTSAAKFNFGIPQGAAATITVGDVTRLEAGDDPTVENSGTTGAAVLDFGIPVYDNVPFGEASGSSVTLTDVYARKPMGITIKPKMVENLWANATKTINGVTVTDNGDGTLSLSGVCTANTVNTDTNIIELVNKLSIKTTTTYTLFVDKLIPFDCSYGFICDEVRLASSLSGHYVGKNSQINTFTTDKNALFCRLKVDVRAEETASGTYRVTLVEGSNANMYVNDSVSLKIGDTTVPINLNGNKLCSLLNGPQDEIQITPTGTVKLIKRVDEDTTTALESPQEITLPSVTLPALDAPVATISVVTDLPSEVTVTYERDINLALKKAEEIVAYNDSTGTYSRQGIANMINRQKDGLVYGYRQYKDIDTQLDKLGANLGMPVPIPGTLTTPPDDPYLTKGGPFFWREVNGKVDADGNLDVTAFMEDAKFSRTDPDGDVATLTPTLYEKWVETEDYIDHYICDSPLSGFTIQPGGKDINGDPRPFILHAKYPASKDSSGKVRSVSGAKPLNFVSHNSLITLCANATTGYSAFNHADDWYIKTMYALKYASKHSQSKFPGCTSYALQYKVSVAESNTNRVIIAKSSANNLVVGSSCSLGTNPTGATNTDRGNAQARDIFDIERITRIESYDANNSAVYFEDVDERFTTTTNSLLSTMAWWTGSCDDIVGDGQIDDNGKYPFVMQGIELGLGFYEIMGNVIIKNDGSTGWKAYVNHDSKNEKTTYDADVYEDTDLILPTDSNDSWKYPKYYKSYKGLLSSDNTGGSQSTGMCDGIYTNRLSTVGEREWRSFGGLWDGGSAGHWVVIASGALSLARWVCGSRLSFVGRSEG